MQRRATKSITLIKSFMDKFGDILERKTSFIS